MAGERSAENATRATADQAPVDGEPTYEPRDATKGHDVGDSPHEEPIDGASPDPDDQHA